MTANIQNIFKLSGPGLSGIFVLCHDKDNGFDNTKGSCTYYVIMDRGGGSLQMITVFGGGQQMGTVLHRGGRANVSSIP